jgi:hypothetical protein
MVQDSDQENLKFKCQKKEEEKRKDIWQHWGLLWEANTRGKWRKYLITSKNPPPFQLASSTYWSLILSHFMIGIWPPATI